MNKKIRKHIVNVKSFKLIASKIKYRSSILQNKKYG